MRKRKIAIEKESEENVTISEELALVDAQKEDEKHFDEYEEMEENRIIRKTKRKVRLKEILPFLIALSVSIVILIVFLGLRTNVSICEFMTKNVSGKINAFTGKIASKIPFSTFEFFVVFSLCVLFVLLVTCIVLAIKRKGFVSLKILCCIACICFLFGSYYVLVAGFAYNRNPIKQFCPDYQMDYWEFYDMTKWYKADYDALAEKIERDDNGLSVCPYSLDELNEILKKEVQRLDDYFNVESCFTAKPMKLFSQFMSDMRISGITFTPTGDCGVNNKMPVVEFASVAMHEMMHSVGVMRENEANFMACYLLISSENDYLRYCGYIEYYHYLYEGMLYNGNAEELNSVSVSVKAYKELCAVSDYWVNQKSFTDKIGDFFNDLYLKFSGQKEGNDSYYEPTLPGDNSYQEGDRVFRDMNYNNFQQAFMRHYLDSKE